LHYTVCTRKALKHFNYNGVTKLFSFLDWCRLYNVLCMQGYTKSTQKLFTIYLNTVEKMFLTKGDKSFNSKVGI